MPLSAPPRMSRGLVGPSSSVEEQLRAIEKARGEAKRSHSALKKLDVCAQVFDQRQVQRDVTASWLRVNRQLLTDEATAAATLDASLQRLSDVLYDAEARDPTLHPVRLILANLRKDSADFTETRKATSTKQRAALAQLRRQINEAGKNLDKAEKCATQLHDRTKALSLQLEVLSREQQECEASARGVDAWPTEGHASLTDYVVNRLVQAVQSTMRGVPESLEAECSSVIEAAVGGAMIRARTLQDQLGALDASTFQAQQALESRLRQCDLSLRTVNLLGHVWDEGMSGVHGAGLQIFAPQHKLTDLVAIARLQSDIFKSASARLSLQSDTVSLATASATELVSLLTAVQRHHEHRADMALVASMRREDAGQRHAEVEEIHQRRLEQEALRRAEVAAVREELAREAEAEAQAARAARAKAKSELATWAARKQGEEDAQHAERLKKRQAEEEERRLRLVHNAERVALRDAMRTAASEQIAQQREEALAEQRAKEQRLERFLDAVERRLGVVADPDRVKANTTASELRDQVRTEEDVARKHFLADLRRGAAGRHGFTSEQVRADPRAKVLEALQLAGLSATPYAQAVLRGMGYTAPAARTSAENTVFK